VAREYNAPLYPFLLEGVMLNPDFNQEDGIHPNAAGAKLIAQRLVPFAVQAFGLAKIET
jgi:acyl-CoA thioesterase I